MFFTSPDLSQEAKQRSRRNVLYTDQVMWTITDRELECTPKQVELVECFFAEARLSIMHLPRRDQNALTFLLAEQLQALLFRFQTYVLTWQCVNYAGDLDAARRKLEQRVSHLGSFGDHGRLINLVVGEFDYFG